MLSLLQRNVLLLKFQNVDPKVSRCWSHGFLIGCWGEPTVFYCTSKKQHTRTFKDKLHQTGKKHIYDYLCVMYNMRSVRIYIIIIYIYVCIIYTLYVLYHTSAASLQSILFAAKIFAASLGGDSRCGLHLRWGGSLHEVQRGRGSSFLKPLFLDH